MASSKKVLEEEEEEVSWACIFWVSVWAASGVGLALVSLVGLRLWSSSSYNVCSEVRDVARFDVDYECPVAWRRAVKDEAWLSGQFWWRLKAAEKGKAFKYDVMERTTMESDAVFRDWDDSAPLARFGNGERAKIHATLEETDWRRALGAIFASTQSTKHLAAQFNGAFADIFLKSEDDFFPFPEPPTEKNVLERDLWVAGSRVASWPRFDFVDTYFVVLAGEIMIELAAPSEAASFDFYPALSHPEGGQAKIDAFIQEPHKEVLLRAGDALLIPAGWIYKTTVGDARPAAAVSTKENTFQTFLDDKARLTNFQGAALLRFCKSLHALIVVKEEDEIIPQDYYRGGTVFSDIARGAYDPDTRRAFGLSSAPPKPECPYENLSPEDALRADTAAEDVARHFRNDFRPSLRYLLLAPFFEHLLKAQSKGATNQDRLNDALRLIDLCLLDNNDDRQALS